MNEQALQDAFSLFTEEGYNGSFEDYKELIKTNENALKDSYNLFRDTGYNGSQDDFNALMGLKPVKIRDSASADPTVESKDTGSNLVGGSSEFKLSDQQALLNYKKRTGKEAELDTISFINVSVKSLIVVFNSVKIFESL